MYAMFDINVFLIFGDSTFGAHGVSALEIMLVIMQCSCNIVHVHQHAGVGTLHMLPDHVYMY